MAPYVRKRKRRWRTSVDEVPFQRYHLYLVIGGFWVAVLIVALLAWSLWPQGPKPVVIPIQ